jgi:hypothetical protein
MVRMRPVADAYILCRLSRWHSAASRGFTDASILTTLFAVGALANAPRAAAAPSPKPVRLPPSFASTVMVGAVVREIPGSIGGAHTRGNPFAVPAAIAAFVRRRGV